jgi:hypothetical protein
LTLPLVTITNRRGRLLAVFVAMNALTIALPAPFRIQGCSPDDGGYTGAR